MGLNTRELEEENAKLKRDLETAVAMIELLAKYRQFVLFTCSCSTRDKQLLKAGDRYEQLANDCRFLPKKSQNEEVAEELDSEMSDGERSQDDKDEAKDEIEETEEDVKKKVDEEVCDEEESSSEDETEDSDWTEEATGNKAKRVVKRTGKVNSSLKSKTNSTKKRINSNAVYARHEKVKTSSGRIIKCLDCERTYTSYNGFKNHWDTKHSRVKKTPVHQTRKGKFPCDWPGCEQILQTKAAQKTHRLFHDGEKTFACEWPGCDYKSKYKGVVKAHAERHSQERKFSCHWPGCTLMFIIESEARKHLKEEHMGVKKSKCDWPNCDYRARGNYQIKLHMAKHTRERNFACTWPGCDKKYLCESNLRYHLVVHKGLRPFKCKVPGCSKDFASGGTLRTHVRLVHEKVKKVTNK